MTARPLALADLNDVGGATTVILEITTGASPVDIPLQDDPSVWRVIVKVTTGGTAGEEVLNLPLPGDFIDDDGNPYFIAQEIVICIVDQTDPADVVKITVDDDPGQFFFSAVPDLLSVGSFTNLTLGYLGACVNYRFVYDGWAVIDTDGYFDWEGAGQATIVHGQDGSTAEPNAGGINVRGGGGAGVAGTGGNATVGAGNGAGTGHGGALLLVAGASPSGNGGSVSLLPGNGTNKGDVKVTSQTVFTYAGAAVAIVTVVGSLPAAGSVPDGTLYIVTDATAPTLGATVTGSGSVRVMVNSDGTNWRVG